MSFEIANQENKWTTRYVELTVILGDTLLPRGDAVEAALGATGIDRRNFEVFVLAPQCDATSIAPHSNPDYAVRVAQHRKHWKQALHQIRRSSAHYVIIVAGAFGETAAGPELVLPVDIVGAMLKEANSSGGTTEIVCLIDDVFADPGRNCPNVSRRLTVRQLEWTFAQYLASQFRGESSPSISCHSMHHPVTNLAYILSRASVGSVYLCYPINFFRRNPTHPLRRELDAFREKICASGLIVYDPMGIDEEALISQKLGERTSDSLTLRAHDRWVMPCRHILATEPELAAHGLGITISPIPSAEVGRQAKAQVPQRDFFWIESADAVVSWRPFLGNTHHAGVLSELQFALHKNKPILAFSPSEDGGEHPSPFASMVSTVSNEEQFLESIMQLNKNHNRHVKRVNSQKPPKYCDHTSVGVLIYNENNELLLIERGTFPFGMAVPAGHVDEHASFEEAAVAEVREEVGLEVDPGSLRLVAEGRRENQCRRVNGSWHYWKVFEARASGSIRLSPREAKKAEWCSNQRLVELGMASREEATPANSLEPVWLNWLRELKILSK